MKLLSIIIPVYNEERFVAALVNTVLSVDLGALGLEKELVIVNDASRDNTLVSLAPFQSDQRITIISHDVNQGKGSALPPGFHVAAVAIVIIQEADLESTPPAYVKILRPIVD